MKLIPVFRPDQDVKKERFSPFDEIPEDKAQELVMRGLAEWRSIRGFVIQLRTTFREWDKRGLSAAPREWLLDMYVEGDEQARGILDGRKWTPICDVIINGERQRPVTDAALLAFHQALNAQNDSAVSVAA